MPGTAFTLDADLVLLAMGFTGPVRAGLIEQAGLKLDAARQSRDGELSDVDSGRLRRGRRPARAIAGGLGHRRGAQGGCCRGRLSARISSPTRRVRPT